MKKFTLRSFYLSSFLNIILFVLLFTDICHAEEFNSISIESDSNTGAAVSTIPLNVPPGRKGIQPNLALNYNSYVKNGWLGVGWDLPIPYISRNTRFGVNYANNDFVDVSGGLSELVPRSDWGVSYFGRKKEGAFSKYYFNPTTGWEVTAKDGTKYYYGSTPAARQDNARGVFKWMLNKVQDTNGNFMTFTYVKDQGEIYISRIDYTGNGTTAPSNYIIFYWETRTDAPPMYTSNASVVTKNRLKTVLVYGNGQLARKYILNYTYSTSTYRSLLTSLTQYGSDGVSTLPVMTFAYQEGGDRTYSFNGNGDYGPGAFVGYYFLQADHNGDGKTDQVAFNPTSGYLTTMLSNGDGTYTYNGGGDYGPNSFVGYKLYPADVNGDGKTDIVAHNPTSGYVTTMISNGDRTYTFNGNGDYGPGYFVGYNFYPADVNGDGKTDIVAHNPTAGYVITMISNGDRTYTFNGSGDYGPGYFVGYNFYPGDVNGDGKADIIAHNPTTGYLITMISKGDRTYTFNGNGDYGPGFFKNGNSSMKTLTTPQNYNFYIADVNGDGKADIVVHEDTQGSVWTLMSNGDRTYTYNTSAADYGPGYFVNYKFYSADVNGDGRTDIITHDGICQ